MFEKIKINEKEAGLAHLKQLPCTNVTYLSWFAFLYPFMFEIPARSNEFEQLCECLRRCASAELAGPELLLVFLNAEKSFCHLDIEAAAVVVVEAEAADVDDEADDDDVLAVAVVVEGV